MIPKPILFGSTNRGKFRELEMIAREFGIKLLDPDTLVQQWNPVWGAEPPVGPPPEVDEVEDSYEGNARLKAEAYFGWSGLPSLGDDTGLEVDALAGEPGIRSARYAGIPSDPRKNIEKLLGELHHAQNRSARFRCVLHLTWGRDLNFDGEGVLEGAIAQSSRGEGGFGYDSIFIVKGTGKTLAELKAGILEIETHRHRAAQELFHRLKSSPLVADSGI